MARNRVYRHDVRCPGCGPIPFGKLRRMRKDGYMAGQRATRCGDCRRRSVPGGACSDAYGGTRDGCRRSGM